jgi:hypothetical protein
MNTALAIVGALGGLTVFFAAVIAVIRSVVRQVGATEDNTEALRDMKDALTNMDGKMNGIINRLDNHAERIASLEGGRH